jgi:hypothetical protein
MLPFTPPFSTCSLGALLLAPRGHHAPMPGRALVDQGGGAHASLFVAPIDVTEEKACNAAVPAPSASPFVHAVTAGVPLFDPGVLTSRTALHLALRI